MSCATFVRLDESREASGKQSHRNYYFGERGSNGPGPEGFMLRFNPLAGLPAHFHDVNQFQVFFGTPGATFQKSQLAPLMVQYAGAGSLYGPFAAGGQHPLQLMTLRQQASSFTGVMPDNRDQLAPPGVRKHFARELGDWLHAPLPAAGEIELENIAPEDGPVAAFAVLVGSGAQVTGPAPSGTGGQYYVVTEGEVSHDGKVLPELTIGWCPAESEAPTLRGGEQGARLLVLQFAPIV